MIWGKNKTELALKAFSDKQSSKNDQFRSGMGESHVAFLKKISEQQDKFRNDILEIQSIFKKEMDERESRINKKEQESQQREVDAYEREGRAVIRHTFIVDKLKEKPKKWYQS